MTGRDVGPQDVTQVYPDVVALDGEVFARVAETHPGVIRTLSVLLGELSDLDGLAPEQRRALGDHLSHVGETVIDRANHTGGDGHAE
ncbi:MAG: hypothetical protein ACRDQB_05295 [Thermocrispum sp.]